MKPFLLDTRKIAWDGESTTWLANTIFLEISFLMRIPRAICHHNVDYPWTMTYFLHPPYFFNRLMSITYPA
jgi:hypothetical protein